MMSRIAHVVRIQGRYVYRRRVHFRNVISKPLSFALRTACPKMARRTSARLSARFEEVKDKIAAMLWDCRLQGKEAVIQRQQRMLAEGDYDRLLFYAQYRRMGILRPRRQILDCRALLPLNDGLLVDPVTLGQNPQALLTMLHRSTDCLCRAGAAV